MAGTARVRDGWLEVDCDAPDRAKVYLGVGTTESNAPEPRDWRGAYRDYDDHGHRVAKIRPPRTGAAVVWLKIDEKVTKLPHVVTL